MFWTAGQAVARLRRALNDNLEHLLLLEHVADFDALQDGGSGTPHIAGLDACLLSLRQIYLDLGDGLFGSGFHASD